jgi:shikimate kinase
MNAPPPVFLVGFMGSGKSAVGEILADRRGWSFMDTDRLVEREEQSTIARLLAEKGEAWFRSRELELLRTLSAPRQVVAAGGGLYTLAAARLLMRSRGPTIWLDASLDRVRERVGDGSGRPLWPAGDDLALRELYERRRAVYALARLRIPADGPAEEVAAEADHLISLVFR